MFFLASSAATLEQLPVPLPRLFSRVPEPKSRPWMFQLHPVVISGAELHFFRQKNTEEKAISVVTLGTCWRGARDSLVC